MSKESKDVVYVLTIECEYGNCVLGVFSDKETAMNKMTSIKDSLVNSVRKGVDYEVDSTSEEYYETVRFKHKGKVIDCLEVVELEKDVLYYSF